MPSKGNSKPGTLGDVKDQTTLRRPTVLLEDAQTLHRAVAQLRSALLRGRERDYGTVAQALEKEVTAVEPRRFAHQHGVLWSKAGDCWQRARDQPGECELIHVINIVQQLVLLNRETGRTASSSCASCQRTQLVFC
jgi:hypothetical protein